ncbi:MAG TPA: class I SAM-dependent methyltransferase [Candidatus Angelobacter sp.]|nr:class I SAM-dependent methyltransferase [Candidatus Angelobacter sp.]
MSTLDTKKNIVDRFNKEALVWNEVHTDNIQDIIQWEVKKRKRFAHDFIRGRFQGKPAAILEIGCGAGRNLEEILAGDALWTGKGVDNAAAMVAHCQKQYENNPRVGFEQLDIDSASLDQQFDVILLLGVVGYLDSNSKAFQNIQRMLRPGGYVIFTFGKGMGVARTLRAVTGAAKNAVRRLVRGKQSGGAPTSFFRNYTWSDVKRAFPPEWELMDYENLVFGSGVLGRYSVPISRIFERLFAHHDIFRFALTSIVVAGNKKR